MCACLGENRFGPLAQKRKQSQKMNFKNPLGGDFSAIFFYFWAIFPLFSQVSKIHFAAFFSYFGPEAKTDFLPSRWDFPEEIPERPRKRSSGVAPANQTKERSVHELSAGAFRIPEQKFNVNRACFPREHTHTPEFTKKWAKFIARFGPLSPSGRILASQHSKRFFFLFWGAFLVLSVFSLGFCSFQQCATSCAL